MARKTNNTKTLTFHESYEPSDYGRKQLQNILDEINASIMSIEGVHSDLNDGLRDWIAAAKDIRLGYLSIVINITADSDYYATLVRGHQLRSVAATLAIQAQLLHDALENYIPKT